MLTFDEAEHRYFWHGTPVPGVTTVLKALHNFDGVPEAILSAAAERGTAVHLCCEYLDQGILDEASIDPAISGYVDAWRLFCTEMLPVWSHIEARCYHQALRFAGTVDRVGIINGIEYVLDIKTSVASHPVWGVQTAAYANALNKANARRATVQLRKDGTYRMIEWAERSDWSVFVSLITINNFLEQHK